MARLPQPGGDAGNWGAILNDYLAQSHASDGVLKPGVVGNTQLTTSVQSSLDKAESAYQKPNDGIPLNDLKQNELDATYGRLFKPPNWWNWDFGFPISFDGLHYTTSFDVSRRKNRETTNIYVHTIKGDNTTGNGTMIRPYRSISRAVSAASDGASIIVLNNDPVYRVTSIDTTTDQTKSFNLIFADPDTIVACADALTYTLSPGYSNVYEASRTNVRKVIDVSINVTGAEYTRVADVAACDATEGSWYQASDGTGKVYVNPLGSGAPAVGQVFCLLQDGLLRFSTAGRTSSQRIYIEGGRFFGGTIGTCYARSINQHKLFFNAKNTKFLHGGYGSVGASVGGLANGFVILGNVESFSQEVEVSYSVLDGFNYHADSGYIPKFVEINCTAHDNGTGQIPVAAGVGNTQNSSTAHDGVEGLRLGGKYHRSFGSIVADVQPGTKTLNLSCEAGASTDPGHNNASFCAQQSGATMGLYDCVCWGTTWNIYAVTGAAIYYDNLTEWSTRQGAGLIEEINGA